VDAAPIRTPFAHSRPYGTRMRTVVFVPGALERWPLDLTSGQRFGETQALRRRAARLAVPEPRALLATCRLHDNGVVMFADPRERFRFNVFHLARKPPSARLSASYVSYVKV
jgi:hypothetical protein